MNLQVLASLSGRLLLGLPPVRDTHDSHDSKVVTISRILEQIDSSHCITDKGYTGTRITAPDRKLSQADFIEGQK